MTDQATEQSVEGRLASFFSEPQESPAEQPEVAQQETGAVEENVEQVEASAEDAEQPEEQQAEPDSGYEEIEIDGETYRVPPVIKKAVMQERDYTRKSQEVAEASRQLQARELMLSMQAQFAQATQQDAQQLQQLEHQIGQYKQLNWAEMDSETLTRARFQMDQLREQAQELKHGLANKAQQFEQWLKQTRQKHIADGAEYLRKAIPKFDQEVVRNVRQYANAEGYTEAEMEQVTDPRFVKLLWKASQYDALKAQQKSAVEQAKKAPPVIKPGASQGQQQVAAKQYKALRDNLRKSGSIEDAARLFMK